MRNIFWTICLLSIVSCSGKKQSCSGKKQSAAEAVSDTIPTVEVAEDVNIRPADKHVPFYDEIGKYDNNLSSIASGVRFVKLDDEPLFRDFLIHDVQQCDSFLFLLGGEHIFMYDASGKFFRMRRCSWMRRTGYCMWRMDTPVGFCRMISMGIC